MTRFVILALILCFLPFSVSLADNLGSYSQDEISINMIPSIPGANQNIRVDVVSYVTDINSAKITWSVDGKVIKSGTGLKTFYFTTGNFNQETDLQIAITTIEGGTIVRNIKIKPADVDLVWQANTYVPPFYKGKALFSHQSKITFIAIPHITDVNGKSTSPGKLLYKWTVNGNVDQDASGYGKEKYSFFGNLISRPLDVTVDVTDPNTGGEGVGNVVVTPIVPSVIVYERSPLYGIMLQKAVSGILDIKNIKEITILALPLFYGVDKADSTDLNYKWSINGKSLNNPENEYSQVFRRNDDVAGISNISVSIESLNRILQYSNTEFKLQYEEIKNSNSSL